MKSSRQMPPPPTMILWVDSPSPQWHNGNCISHGVVLELLLGLPVGSLVGSSSSAGYTIAFNLYNPSLLWAHGPIQLHSLESLLVNNLMKHFQMLSDCLKRGKLAFEPFSFLSLLFIFSFSFFLPFFLFFPFFSHSFFFSKMIKSRALCMLHLLYIYIL